jgi:dienelactone hydrolase
MFNYDLTSYLQNLYDKAGRQYRFCAKNIEEHEAWKGKLKNRLIKTLGLDRMQSCELTPQFVESESLEGFRRDKVIIQTEPGVWMPMYILIPEDLKKDEKRPVVVAVHGHHSGGKFAVAGREDIPEVREAIEKYNYNYGIKLVKQGFVVFCSDARGSGERNDDIMRSACADLNNAAISIGQSLLGMWIWDLIRLVDYIQTLDYCDSSSIGACGFSGGGLSVLYLSALEERVKAAVVSGYFHGYRDAILKTNLCSCNFVPGLWSLVDVGDVGAMIAPKSLLIESGSEDRLNGERGITDVLEQVSITNDAYRLYGREDNLVHHVFNGGHRWDGEKTYDFLRNEL